GDATARDVGDATTADSIGAARAHAGSRSSSGIPCGTNETRSMSARGTAPMRVAAIVVDVLSAGGPPHTPRCGFLQAIGPVHGCRMAYRAWKLFMLAPLAPCS